MLMSLKNLTIGDNRQQIALSVDNQLYPEDLKQYC
jgi:hypothetical protein